jgi:hypothetical protein
MKGRKGYETVCWGKMPINFRPQAFRTEEVERAVDYATRSFPDALDLGREETAVLVLGDEREARGFRRDAGEGNLEGLL